MKKTEEIKVSSGDMAIVFLEKTMAVYKNKKKLCELERDDAKDLMICFFDTIDQVNRQEELKKIVKGKRKPKTSKHK